MYAYKTEERTYESSSTRKEKTHQVMFGTEYHIIPKTLRTFVEWQASRTKEYRRDQLRSKERNYTTVVGLRAYW